MSANPNPVDGRASEAEFGSPLQQGNRVLESIARGEAFPALLTFSELHEQIRSRRVVAGRGRAFDRDLFETERFILDEVLQLICDRAQALTEADSVMIALAEGPDMVCRAASGGLNISRGTRLNGDSGLLGDCLESGRVLRCDDCKTDTRVRSDFAREIGARSTVIVPLLGRRVQLGVLQAFSTRARAFTDYDVRCFDLFAELVLSALKPVDQDRRVTWLSDVADEVLQAKPATEMDAADQASAEAAQSAFEVERSEDADESAGSPQPTLFRSGLYSIPLSPAANSRPGLGVVISLVLVAGLFAAGAWWKMQVPFPQIHTNTSEGGDAKRRARGKTETETTTETTTKTPISPQPAFPGHTPSERSLSSEVSEIVISDGLLDGSKSAPNPAAADIDSKSMARITGVRHWSSAAGSTVVIDMEDEVPYEVHRLASPERIYFDLHGTALSPELEGKTVDVGDTSLSRVRIGQPIAGVTRVVLDTKDGANFSVSMESSPFRLVVELRSSEKLNGANATFSNPTNRPSGPVEKASIPPSSSSGPVASLLPGIGDQPVLAKTGKFRIVLDAGHGGWDLGTVGRHGLLEKDLVLDVTERLGKLLQTRLGSEVMFTRIDDTYLPLDQRADLANQAQADLFVSVHANYSTSVSARGIETYYTNLFSSPGSREAEKHEDGTFTQLTPVTLSAEGLHDKIEESRRLAASVQRSLYATLASNNPDIRNRGIKDAAFAVLTGTTMPSILTEVSFVSSPADEHNLQNSSYRQQIAEALYQGIANYRHSVSHVKVAQLQTATR